MSGFDARPYWEDRLGKEYSLHGVGFGGLGQGYNSWMYRVRARVFRRLLADMKLDLSQRRILDVGSGTGFYLNLMAKAGARGVTGSDITQTAVDRLAPAFPTFDVQRLDVSDPAQIPARTFDLVTAFDVLFHIVDDERYAQAFRNIFSLLEPGGLLIFSDNFLHGPRLEMTHQVSRSLEEISRVVLDAGFEILDRRPMFMHMNAPVDAPPEELQAWKARMKIARKSERAGHRLGRRMYLREILDLRTATESPTTEMMVCWKPPRGRNL